MSGPAPSIQYAWDGPGTLGAGQDGYALVWSQSQGKFIAATAGVTDHGALSGLADDDHPQYALADGSRGSFAATSHNHAGVYLPIAGKAADSELLDGLDSTAFALSGHSHSAPAHSALSGLTSGDDHPQYALLAGRSGGQTIIGGTASGNNLTLQSTSNATKGRILSDAMTVLPLQTGIVGLKVQAFSGDGTTELANFNNGSGSTVASVGVSGVVSGATFGAIGGGVRFTPGTSAAIVGAVNNLMDIPWSATAGITVRPGAATGVGFTVQGAASQSANLTEWQNSAGAALAAMSATGRLRLFGGGGAGGTAELSFCGSVYNGHIHTGAAGGPTWMVISNGDRSQKTDLTWISPNGTNYYAGSALSMMGQTFTYNTFEASALTPTVVFTATKTSFSVTPAAATTGSPTLLTLTGPAHTTLTASTEAIDAYFNLSRTVQFATGALTTQRAVVITPPTYAFVGASTITNAVTLDVTGAPVAGTNATITNSYALRVQGAALFTSGGDKLRVNSTGIGFFGVAPVARASAYTPTNVTTDRSYDANATTLDELADVVGTLIADLQAYGLLQ